MGLVAFCGETQRVGSVAGLKVLVVFLLFDCAENTTLLSVMATILYWAPPMTNGGELVR
jgi:hypothetical protein